MIVYLSRTGNVKFIVDKLKLPSIQIKDDLLIESDYFLITYTDGLGDVPGKVLDFLQNNSSYLKGVIATGNSNFGNNFCKAADSIGELYGVPVISKLELRGYNSDYEKIKYEYNKIIKKEVLK